MTSAEGRRARSAEANFARCLRVTREALGMSQADLASRITRAGLSMPQQTVARIEAGKRTIRLDEARAISEILKVPLEEMMSDPLEGLSGSDASIAVGDSVAELIALDEEMRRNYEQLESHKTQVRELEEERAGLLRKKAREDARLEALAAAGALGYTPGGEHPPVGTRIAAARLSAGYNTLVLTLRAGLEMEAEPILKEIELNDFSRLPSDKVHAYLRKLARALDMNEDELVTQYERERPESE